ncbi:MULTISPECIES: amidohydrolase family protein [unclassified Ramlibacter]|uniref:amidohydrolase family protein n=1 Tax=unclassified Ramlibacter TaxID=2617605 RepID=UPI0036708008
MHPPPSKTFVDSHFHVFAAGVGEPGARYVPAYDAPLAGWQRAAQAAGVSRGVLVQTSFLGTDNTLLLQALRANPQALRGIAVVAPGARLEDLRAMDAAGVRGIRLNLAGRAGDIEAWAGASPVWDALLALGWHVQLHTDRGGLPAALARLPQALPVVVDHMAKPAGVAAADASVQALAARSRGAAVHVKLSGAYRLGGLDPAALARLWVGELGPRALVWGSDWPCTNHETCADYPALFAALHDWVPPEVAQAALGDNALALYWRY